MDNAIRVFSGRTFSPEDIEMIKWARKRYPGLSRTELASTVCEILDWNTPSGQPKRLQCMNFFSILEAEGVIQLPPIQTARQYRRGVKIPQLEFNTEEISGDIRGSHTRQPTGSILVRLKAPAVPAERAQNPGRQFSCTRCRTTLENA